MSAINTNTQTINDIAPVISSAILIVEKSKLMITSCAFENPTKTKASLHLLLTPVMATESKSNDEPDSIRLIFLHGLPGVGKLTTATILSENQECLPNYKLFHNHMIIEPIKSLFKFGSPSFIKLRELHWLQLLEESFKYKAEQKSNYECDGVIFTFAFETTVTDQFIPNLLELVKKYKNARITFIELICDKDTLFERASSENRKKFSKLTDKGLMQELMNNGTLYSGHKYITETLKQEDIQINSQGKSAEEVAKIIAQKILQL